MVNPGAPGCEYVQNIVRMIFVTEVNDVVSAFNRKNTLKKIFRMGVSKGKMHGMCSFLLYIQSIAFIFLEISNFHVF